MHRYEKCSYRVRLREKQGNANVLIQQQAQGDQKPLTDALAFWERCKYRWAVAYCHSLQNIPKSSLAHASMKASGEKNLSLVDAVFADVADSARLEAKWTNREAGERSQGSGPDGEAMNIRNEIRQINRAHTYVNASQNQGEESSQESSESNDDELPSLFDVNQSHRPDKKIKLKEV